jgi:GNAT superfamily N-acetyltransferase
VVIVRVGRPEDAGEISALALRSKGVWGYDPDFLEACREDLTIDPGWCDGVRLVVAERDGVLLGYARVAGAAPVGELAGLFVDPGAIGSGVGGVLLRRAVEIAAGLGMHTLELDSDPHAEAFYLHAGARRVGESVSTVDPDRRLPRLELSCGGRRSRGEARGVRARRRG